MVADIEELEEKDASELHTRRLNAKEVLTPQRSGNFIFPVADGTVKIFGREQRPRTSTLNRNGQNEGRNKKFLEEKSDELHSPTHFKKTQRGMMRNLKMISSLLQNFIYRHHVEPKVKLYMPKEESLPVPMKYLDVTGTTHTSLDVLLEKQIDDYWNVDGDKEFY